MRHNIIPFWKKAPFFRLLIPLMVGIAIQSFTNLPEKILLYALLGFSLPLISFSLLSFFSHFRFRYLTGVFSNILFICLGALLLQRQDIRNHKNWFAHYYHEKDLVLVRLIETPIEKPASFKAIAEIEYIYNKSLPIPASGKIIVYLEKDSVSMKYPLGTRLVFFGKLQLIKSSGNPGSFDYKRYAISQGISHSIFLRSGDYETIVGKNIAPVDRLLLSIRDWVLKSLRKNIPGEKELGLAEALLIGYKDDLDKVLVQSYSNTGVVHIIAISGLHLGLIYWILVKLFEPLRKRKLSSWLRPLLIIAGLWLFSLLAGGQPSVLRSALMFSCIVAGESLSRKTSIINTLSLSAFLLLCWNPFWLWDLGFQLSYSAVLSIVIFMQPIYNIFFIKNKIADTLWRLNSVTIAAQILTTPISIYNFHQFPNFFLITNLVAVPLSSVILIAEIIICCLAFLPGITLFIGKITSWLIALMNRCVQLVEAIPYSLWQRLQISVLQTMLLYIFILCLWIMSTDKKSKLAFRISLFTLLVFIGCRSLSFIEAYRQQQIIVYNLSKKRAIDIIQGRTVRFLGDPDSLTNIQLAATRAIYRVNSIQKSTSLSKDNILVTAGRRHLLLLYKPFAFSSAIPSSIDLVILSGNIKINPDSLFKTFSVHHFLIDATVPDRRAVYWEDQCSKRKIPFSSIKETGAFIINIE